jgi:hypothetical protein
MIRLSRLRQLTQAGQAWFQNETRWPRVREAVLLGAFVFGATLILSYQSWLPGVASVQALDVGDIASSDITAPYTLEFESAILTERARRAAADSIEMIYDPPDPDIARVQIVRLQQAITFIDDVRADRYATVEQQTSDVRALERVAIPDDTARFIVQLDDNVWQTIAGEALNVLERLMREPIRDIDLDDLRERLPSQVSVRLVAESARVVQLLVDGFLIPNREANPEATQAAREAAAAEVAPQMRRFDQGQTIVQAGTRVDAVDYEALEAFQLLTTTTERWEAVAQAALASILVGGFFTLYLGRVAPGFTKQQFPMAALLAALLLVFMLGTRLFASDDSLGLFPAAALGLLAVSLVPLEIALALVVAYAFFAGVMFDNSVVLPIMIAAGGAAGALTIRPADRLNRYFYAALVIGAVHMILVAVFRVTEPVQGLALTLEIGISLLNGIICGMTALALLYAVTPLFNLPTGIRLAELSHPSQPLLQRLLREAPGTYQHSLQVANLSEQAANAIGANAELVRVAALYHDIGKVINPAFFVENQVDGVNPHDALDDPFRSASIIIAHVTDGDRLARQYRLPTRFRDFILEHHGRTLVGFFYQRALERAPDPDSVDIAAFRYPGPIPQSRETSILMLADICESTVRARKPTTKGEIAVIVRELFDLRLDEGQLDQSSLTLRDIETIRTIFVDMLQGLFHPRMNYPAQKRQTSEAKALPAEAAASTPPARQTPPVPALPVDEETPMAEVPPLRRTRTLPAVSTDSSGKPASEEGRSESGTRRGALPSADRENTE